MGEVKREIKSHFPGGRTLDGYTAAEYYASAVALGWYAKHQGKDVAHKPLVNKALASSCWFNCVRRAGFCYGNKKHARNERHRLIGWLLARAAFAEAQERARIGGGR